MNKKLLQSRIEWLKSEIIRMEHVAETLNKELETMYIRLDETKAELYDDEAQGC